MNAYTFSVNGKYEIGCYCVNLHTEIKLHFWVVWTQRSKIISDVNFALRDYGGAQSRAVILSIRVRNALLSELLVPNTPLTSQYLIPNLTSSLLSLPASAVQIHKPTCIVLNYNASLFWGRTSSETVWNTKFDSFDAAISDEIWYNFFRNSSQNWTWLSFQCCNNFCKCAFFRNLSLSSAWSYLTYLTLTFHLCFLEKISIVQSWWFYVVYVVIYELRWVPPTFGLIKPKNGVNYVIITKNSVI